MAHAELCDSVREAAAHFGAGRLEAARRACDAALPTLSGSGRAAALNLRGMIAFRRREIEAARALLAEAVSLRPDVADYQLNLGNIYGCCEMPAEAIACFDAALRLEPACHEACNGRGVTLATLGDIDGAEEAFRQAVRLRPDFAEAHNHLGAVLQSQGSLDDSIRHLRQACGLRPDYADPHFYLGMALLLQGDFEAGLPEYEWRRRRKPPLSEVGVVPMWDGSNPRGTSIVLYCEEGLGDMFQFIRYARVLSERGAEVVVECPPKMRTVLTGATGVGRVVPVGEPLPAHDWHAPVMSLPWITGTTLDTIPLGVPYLKPQGSRVEQWRRRVDSVPGFRVGICWQGSNSSLFLGRHFHPSLLRPLAELPGVTLVSLQTGSGAELLKSTCGLPSVVQFDDLDAGGDAFADTAALIPSLDLVITSDTSIAHLAGALGAPVWVALPWAADWRWLLERRDSPWYPSMRLFRQPRRGEWTAVFAEMADELGARPK
jgi:Flp pilus assembly protein TadD